jgi:hypothetical protein
VRFFRCRFGFLRGDQTGVDGVFRDLRTAHRRPDTVLLRAKVATDRHTRANTGGLGRARVSAWDVDPDQRHRLRGQILRRRRQISRRRGRHAGRHHNGSETNEHVARRQMSDWDENPASAEAACRRQRPAHPTWSSTPGLLQFAGDRTQVSVRHPRLRLGSTDLLQPGEVPAQDRVGAVAARKETFHLLIREVSLAS